MGFLRAALCAALLSIFAAPAPAQDVTLTSRDGDVEVSGMLLGFDGEFYRVQSVYGELTIDASGVSCEGPGCPNLADFVAEIAFSGSATMGEVLMPALIEGFARREGYDTRRIEEDAAHFRVELIDREEGRTSARFFFRTTTTSEGFADLLANEADIVMALREVRTDERRLIFEAGMGDLAGRARSLVLALDAVVPIVAPENPLREITLPDLADILAGRIENWEDLGGPEAPIDLYLPEPGTGLAQTVQSRLLPSGPPLSETALRHPPGVGLAAAVARNPFALGLASFAEIGDSVPLTLRGPCGFHLSASRRTIKTEDYPLTAPMFLYLPARRLPKLGRDFMAYLRSPAAQIVIRRAGFVDQAPEEIPIDRQGDRFANAIAAAGPETRLAELRRMVEILRPYARLSISFRFEAGSIRLDAQSRSNVQQLARAIEAGTYDARSLLFAGFSDGVGAADLNARISKRRADAVRDAVLAAAEAGDPARIDIRTEAFGEAMPMACDDSAWGRQVNRRVEVWVR